MKRILSKALILTLLLQLTSPLSAIALTQETQTRLTEANAEVRTILKIDADYYTPENRNGKPLNESYVENGITSKEYPAFVYGTSEEASKAATRQGSQHFKSGEYRCHGYASDGDMYTNQDFPADDAMAKYADTKSFISKPWDKRKDIELVGRIMGDTPAYFDMNQLKERNQLPDLYRKSIALGIGLQYGIYWDKKLKGISEEQIRKDIATLSRGYKGNMVNGEYLALHWEEYCHIIQPPTAKSWGAGVVFHNPSPGVYRYFSVPLPPLELTPTDDLSVKAVNMPTEVGLRLKAEVTLEVDSTYKTDQNTVYKWEVLNSKTGAPVEGVTYSGKATAPEGRLAITPIKGLSDDDGGAEIPEEPQLVKATFTMPDSNVIIRFRINNLVGDDPAEKLLTNNLYTATITKLAPLQVTTPHDLDYNVLSKEITHPLAKGAALNASVSLPEGFWTGNLKGNLDIEKVDPQDFLKDYEVKENPPVNEDSDTVTRQPVIWAKVERSTFGDKPLERVFINLTEPWNPLQGVVDLWHGGNVSRPWRYEWTEYCGSEHCSGHHRSRSGSARGTFASRLDTLGLTCHTYNGTEDLPSVPARTFRKAVDANTISSDTRELFWISDPYDLDVLRWMVHEKRDPANDEYLTVGGQYQRTFTQQNTGSIDFAVNKSMEAIYSGDRREARKGSNNKSNYPNIVFPTDRDLQRYDYPIKSGYYLTPRGEYTVTVKTSQYKDTPDNTPEHAHLVQEIIEAFHYQSGLQLTLDGKDIYALNLTNRNSKIQNTSMLKFDKTTEKTTAELPHTENSTDGEDDRHNDIRIREILEGYSDSLSQASKDNYKYREYMKNQDNLYKVDEETTLTITVNPSKKKLYTYVNMPDSDRTGSTYAIRAWFEPIELNRYCYSGLNITGRPNTDSNSLDSINFHVMGSMYDDVNN